MQITDDGKGIAKSRQRTGSGIDNMKTRAHLISSKFAMEAGRGKGTIVSILLPLSVAKPTGAPAFASEP